MESIERFPLNPIEMEAGTELKEEYNLVGVVKRLAVAKKGIYDGLAVVEQAPTSEIAKEYTAIAKMIINGNFDREDIENG